MPGTKHWVRTQKGGGRSGRMRPARCILGGTFTCVHAGHLRLFSEAKGFGKVTIGLTSGAYVRTHKIYPSFPYSKRLAGLEAALAKEGLLSRTEVAMIDDEVGVADRAPAGAIIVSGETEAAARKINQLRKRRKLPPLRIISVPLAYGESLKKISCADIYAGKIDLQGRLRKPLAIRAGTSNPTKLSGASRALARVFGKRKFSLSGRKEDSRVSRHPFDSETFEGAKNRARAAWKRKKNIDYSLGMESGLFELKKGTFVDITVCCVYDGENESYGTGAGFAVPSWIAKRIRGRSDLTRVLCELSGIEDIGRREGAVGYFSGGLLHRSDQIEQAVANAFVPRIAVAKKGMEY